MILKIFALRDSAIDAYGRPFYAVTRGSAIRSLQDSLAEKSEISRHPEDFELFEIGEYNDGDGVLTPCVPVSVVRVRDLQAK